MERFLADDIVGKIVVSQGGWRISNVPDLASELADEEKVTLGPQGPGGGGVGLHDGAGQGFVVGVDDQLPAFDEVLELPDCRSSRSKVENCDLGSVSRRLKKESGWSLPQWC